MENGRGDWKRRSCERLFLFSCPLGSWFIPIPYHYYSLPLSYSSLFEFSYFFFFFLKSHLVHVLFHENATYKRLKTIYSIEKFNMTTSFSLHLCDPLWHTACNFSFLLYSYSFYKEKKILFVLTFLNNVFYLLQILTSSVLYI